MSSSTWVERSDAAVMALACSYACARVAGSASKASTISAVSSSSRLSK